MFRRCGFPRVACIRAISGLNFLLPACPQDFTEFILQRRRWLNGSRAWPGKSTQIARLLTLNNPACTPDASLLLRLRRLEQPQALELATRLLAPAQPAVLIFLQLHQHCKSVGGVAPWSMIADAQPSPFSDLFMVRHRQFLHIFCYPDDFGRGRLFQPQGRQGVQHDLPGASRAVPACAALRLKLLCRLFCVVRLRRPAPELPAALARQSAKRIQDLVPLCHLWLWRPSGLAPRLQHPCPRQGRHGECNPLAVIQIPAI